MAQYLAADLGATSGRLISATLEGRLLRMQEVDRFRVSPLVSDAHLSWDADAIYRGILSGVRKATRGGGRSTLGIDGWGIDFALLDDDQRLLRNPRMYRDVRRSAVARVESLISPRDMYARTGVQPMPINTVYQLAAMQAGGELDGARTLLPLPDFWAARLTGELSAEFTNATTTQLVDPRSGAWDDGLIEALGLSRAIFPPIVAAGTVRRAVPVTVRRSNGIEADLELVKVASHDTASALAAVPAERDSFGYIASGTWSIVGTELDEPNRSDAALRAGFSNEGGLTRFGFHKTMTGLWLLERCLDEWRAGGGDWSIAGLVESAGQAGPADSFIDVGASDLFDASTGILGQIHQYLHDTGQPPLDSPAAVVRCVLASLAISYKIALDEAAELNDRELDEVFIVGGGSRNQLLCGMTADAMRRPVRTGPAEASAIGNLLTQALAGGAVGDTAELRAIVRTSTPISSHPPTALGEDWTAAERRVRDLRGR